MSVATGEFPQQPETDFEPSQIISATPSPSPRSSAPHLLGSQNGSVNFWEKDKLSINFEDSQNVFSQTTQSQFYCSQVDEMAFYSQSVEYTSKVHSSDSWECASKYAKSVISEVRKNDIKLTPSKNILENQDKINQNDREECIGWIIDNMNSFEVSTRAVFLVVRLLDRTLEKIIVESKDELMKYNVACLCLGAKFENSFAQPVSSYADSLLHKFSEEEIVEAEKELILKLDFNINQTTEIFFLKMWLNEVEGDEELAMTLCFVAFCSFFESDIRNKTAEAIAAAIFRIALNACNPIYGFDVIAESIKKYGYDTIHYCEERIIKKINQILSSENSTLRNCFAIPERYSVSTKFVYEL